MADRSPPVSPHLYSADLLETFAAGEYAAFLAGGGRPLRPRLARSLALAGVRPGMAVVDVGCGRGEAAAHAARRGAEVTAIDFSAAGLALTRLTADTVLAETRRGRVRVMASAATALPLADDCADRVLLLDVVEHLYPWQVAMALREASRILRPGGYVVIHTLPNRWALSVAYPLLRLYASQLPAEARSRYEKAVHVNEQDPRRLKNALSEAGLEGRVWVEEWTTRHATKGHGRAYPDSARSVGYTVLRQPGLVRLARLAMRTPLGWFVGNDLFALAWPRGGQAPPTGGRFQPVRG